MKWLHFSDFHIRGVAGPQEEAMQVLLDYLTESICKVHTIDAVFLVGDIAYSGRESEFSTFERIFFKPLLGLPGLRSAKVFAVPGNHDVDCDAADPITWEGIKKRNQDVYFLENENGKNARKHRTKVFENYRNFVQRNSIYSPDPNETVSEFFECPEFPFDILSTNTSFFSDKEERSSEPITPSPLASLRGVLSLKPRERPLVVLGHHPHSCFLPAQQKPFESFIIDKQILYLHGHEHAPKLSTNADGNTRSIGFGACYVASLGEASQAPYKNTFTLCSTEETLLLQSFTWDSSIGRWSDTTKTDFSSGVTSDTVRGDALSLRLAMLSQSSPARLRNVSLTTLPRKSPEILSLATINEPNDITWQKLITLSDNIDIHYRSDRNSKLQPLSASGGRIEYVLDQRDARDLVICIPGSNYILSAKEIESFNTRLDTEGFRTVTVVSMGKMSSDADVMYSRLRTKKSLEVLVNKDLAYKSIRLLTTAQCSALNELTAGTHNANVLLNEDKAYLLLVRQDSHPSFRVLDEFANTILATDSIVTELRAHNPALSLMAYDGISSSSVFTGESLFDEDAYLKKCYSDNNVLKYAALANVGLRMSDLSLDALYVEATASISNEGHSERIDHLLEDHLAAFPATDKLKQHIKQQIAHQLSADERLETSHARDFHQQYGAILVTGDPGSGKTCFVKSEILAYCRKALPGENLTSNDWHSYHVPVMVQLSQAAADVDLSSEGLLAVAAKLMERRGINFPRQTMENFLKEGRLALFFDGLDEVVSLEKRALVVQKINELVTTGLPLGNRVVVTSRPAAVNVVNLLPTLRTLELQGLTDTEIATLASRILSLKVSESGTGVIVDQHASYDTGIVRQIVQDCAEKPGVARLARNPLLLTLLVMIYANSGAPSAKRHRIYEEAIKTLASVRGRQAGHAPVSTQDLRERLGGVALSVYRKQSGLLPTRKEVVEVVRVVMERQRSTSVTAKEADEFIQKVAESTGLIAIGQDSNGDQDNSIVTFMHHSFMEYFAAVGLSRELNTLDLPALVNEPRWVEILTLLAGIIGESEDIAPIITKILKDGTNYGEVDAKLLLFSLDCALECEIPSDAAVRLLLESVSKCVAMGPARSDPWVRSELGVRLNELVSACGLSSVESSLVTLMCQKDSAVCAAGISVVGHSCREIIVSAQLVQELERCCERTEENVLCAICDAAARVQAFQTKIVQKTVSSCFKRSANCRHAAFEAAPLISGFVSQHWPEIINGLGDPLPAIRRLASKAAIQAGLDGDLATETDAKKDVVAAAFQYMYEANWDGDYPDGNVKKTTVERLLNSDHIRDRLIGIQLLPAVREHSEYIHSKLWNILHRKESHLEVTAALRALRSSRSAKIMFTVGDIKRIATLLDSKTTGDVRLACIQLLGQFPADILAVKSLLERKFNSLDRAEYCTAITALGRAEVSKNEVVELFEKQLEEFLKGNKRRDEDYSVMLCALLEATVDIGRNLNANIVVEIQKVIQDYKYQESVRRAALRSYAAASTPTTNLVDYYTARFNATQITMIEELAQTPSIIAANCRQSIDHVVACVHSFSNLRSAAVCLHKKVSTRTLSHDLQLVITALRDGIDEVDEIITTFNEFIRV